MMWVYHPNHDAKIVDFSEGERLLDSGWYDTPAAFSSKENENEIETKIEEISVEEDLQELRPLTPIDEGKQRRKSRSAQE